MKPFNVVIPRVADPDLGPLLTRLAEAGYSDPVVERVPEDEQDVRAQSSVEPPDAEERTAGAKREVIQKAVRDWNAGDLDGYMSMYADGAILHGYGSKPIGKREAAAIYADQMAAFPGSQVCLHEIIEASDRLVVRCTQSGRHDGEFMGMPGTGREFELYSIVIDRHEDGQVIERHSVADMLRFFKQLGFGGRAPSRTQNLHSSNQDV